MKVKAKKQLFLALCLLGVIVLFTVLVRFVLVRPIGPLGTSVGFAPLNGYVHALVGVHPTLYVLTDWLGLVPIAVMMGFAVLGLLQWIKRKRLFAVDRSILALGMLYIAVFAAYLFFEQVVINDRPVLIEGILEASYPSSTTLLVLTVMPTAAIELGARLPRTRFTRAVRFALFTFSALMVIARFLSGVHWLTDIIGGILLSSGFVMLYAALGQSTQL